VSGSLRVIGIVLVHDEDVFLERAIRNVADFCDRIHAVDHVSRDRTPEILRGLAAELDHLDVRRARHAAASHRVLEQYAGTRTWVIGVDGDELFDPGALARLRSELEAGALAEFFMVKAHVLNCDELDEEAGIARGWMAPPSRPVTKLFNLAAVDAWTGCAERLHGGDPVFRPGFGWKPWGDIAARESWETDPLRCVHTCFLRRSSLEGDEEVGHRRNLDETRAFRRGWLGRADRALRPPRLSPGAAKVAEKGTTWKWDWYTRGDRVEVDASPFLGASARQAVP
jgi:hypothetical protein